MRMKGRDNLEIQKNKCKNSIKISKCSYTFV